MKRMRSMNKTLGLMNAVMVVLLLVLITNEVLKNGIRRDFTMNNTVRLGILLILLGVIGLFVTELIRHKYGRGGKPDYEDLISEDFTYHVLADGSAEIVSYSGTYGKLDIPLCFNEHFVRKIGDKAFYNRKSPKRVRMTNWVTAIGDYAFGWCTSLTSAELSNALTTLGKNPFIGCKNLSKILLVGNHTKCAVISNVLFDRETKRMVSYPSGLKNTSYTVPNGVRVIDDFAFYENHMLRQVVLPNCVRSMGKNPFMKCNNLDKIILRSTNRYFTFDGDALYEVTTKKLVSYMPYSLKREYTVQSGVEIIGDNSFCSHLFLTKVVFNEGVISIGEMAFARCAYLTNIELPSSILMIGKNAFWDCSGLTHINLPKNLTSIGASAFACCAFLEEVTLPRSIKFIGENAFDSCPILTLKVYKKSYAHKYAEKNGLKYELI